MKRIKILTWNMGYLAGIRGGIEYLTKAHRLLRTTTRPHTKTVLASLALLIKNEQPDIIFLAEVHDTPALRKIADMYAISTVDSKYKSGDIMSHIPRVRKNSNALFIKNDLPFSRLYLKYGTKKLLYAVELAPDTTLIAGHFALTANARAKQFLEISLVYPEKKLVVTGDFNIFGGESELTPLLSKRNLRIANDLDDFTFPTKHLRHALDLFLVPQQVEATIAVKREIQTSDHLPVVCDILIP